MLCVCLLKWRQVVCEGGARSDRWARQEELEVDCLSSCSCCCSHLAPFTSVAAPPPQSQHTHER